jgi:hypothetical protein
VPTITSATAQRPLRKRPHHTVHWTHTSVAALALGLGAARLAVKGRGTDDGTGPVQGALAAGFAALAPYTPLRQLAVHGADVGIAIHALLERGAPLAAVRSLLEDLARA